MQKIEQAIEKNGDATNQSQINAGLANNHTTAEEKKLRVHHNKMLTEYYLQKAKDPYALRDKLIEQFEKSKSGDIVVAPAPHFNFNEKAPVSDETNKDMNMLINSLHSGSPPTTTPSTQASSYNQSPSSSQVYLNINGQSPSEINSILIYNIAAMSYQV